MGLIKKIVDRKFVYELDIDGTIITAADIKGMDRQQLHSLCGFLETGQEIFFVKENCEDEIIEAYLDNLSDNISRTKQTAH